MASLGDDWVRAGGDPRGGRVYRSRSGAWWAWRRRVGNLGVFPSRQAAVTAIGKAKPPKRRRNGAARPAQLQLIGETGDRLSARLIGDEANRHIFARDGRKKVGAVTTTADGRCLAFSRTEPLGAHPSTADPARAVVRATRNGGEI